MGAAGPAANHDPRPRNGRAHVVGPGEPPLWRKTIPAALKETVARHGARDAAVFVEQGRRFTWAEFEAEADALAAGLLKLG
ncbi:MAG: AMP-binding protein, partial [Alphaproteobacteria bacterium]